METLESMIISFVILHYESLEDTKECLVSLQKYIDHYNRNTVRESEVAGDTVQSDYSLRNVRIEVVVVDNGSVNGRLDNIESDYNDIECIHFLYSEENLGFAKGNNIGFGFAKNELKSDIILLCNNDLIFEDKDFVENLIQIFEACKYDVAGPEIISLVDGKNQNPVPYQYPKIKDVNVRIIKYQILYWLSFFNLDTVLQKKFSKEVVEYHPGHNDEFQLFGACLIFTKRYIAKFDGLYDGTFMYNEESILKERCIKNSLNMQYIEGIKVYHKEGSSTGAKYGKGKKKRQFYYKWNIHSCRILKRIKMGEED